jgi:hypothetical protein
VTIAGAVATAVRGDAFGGGVAVANGDLTMVNCTVVNCAASANLHEGRWLSHGGAVIVMRSAQGTLPKLLRVHLQNNHAYRGRAIFVEAPLEAANLSITDDDCNSWVRSNSDLLNLQDPASSPSLIASTSGRLDAVDMALMLRDLRIDAPNCTAFDGPQNVRQCSPGVCGVGAACIPTEYASVVSPTCHCEGNTRPYALSHVAEPFADPVLVAYDTSAQGGCVEPLSAASLTHIASEAVVTLEEERIPGAVAGARTDAPRARYRMAPS